MKMDKPWFWKVSLSQARKPDEAPKPPKPPAVRLGGARTQRRKVTDLETPVDAQPADTAMKPGNDPITGRAMKNSTPQSSVVVEKVETDSRPNGKLRRCRGDG